MPASTRRTWSGFQSRQVTSNTASSRDGPRAGNGRVWTHLGGSAKRGYVPARAAQDLKCPRLILQGGRDYQSTVANFEVRQKSLKGKPSVTCKLRPGLNHLFTSGEGKCTPADYEKPGHVAAEVVRDIAQWLAGPAS